MSDNWYNEIAKRNNGYKTYAKYSKVGISGETIFSERILKLINNNSMVLDAGCGHGDFSIMIASKVKKLIGFDFSQEMIKRAKELKQKEQIGNAEFLFASTKSELPFEKQSFDLIYSRRGPTSIIDHPDILKNGGLIIGIHSASMDKVNDRLTKNSFVDIEIDEFNDSYLLFDNEIDYVKYLSDFPGNPNYENGENEEELKELVNKNSIDGKIKIKEWRFIWKAMKK